MSDEEVTRVRRIIGGKNPGLSAGEKDEICKIIGIGAVKYAELSQNRLANYILDWDNMLALKSNNAPYLINPYLRPRAIFNLQKAWRFAEVVPTVLSDFRPNLPANYLQELANTSHGFYEHCPALHSEGGVRYTRLGFCNVTSQTLKKGLDLLGIQTTERMRPLNQGPHATAGFA